MKLLDWLAKHLDRRSRRAVLEKEEHKLQQRFDVLEAVRKEVELYKLDVTRRELK